MSNMNHKEQIRQILQICIENRKKGNQSASTIHDAVVNIYTSGGTIKPNNMSTILSSITQCSDLTLQQLKYIYYIGTSDVSCFGMFIQGLVNLNEIDTAIKYIMWTDLQIKWKTIKPIFDGILDISSGKQKKIVSRLLCTCAEKQIPIPQKDAIVLMESYCFPLFPIIYKNIIKHNTQFDPQLLACIHRLCTSLSLDIVVKKGKPDRSGKIGQISIPLYTLSPQNRKLVKDWVIREYAMAGNNWHGYYKSTLDAPLENFKYPYDYIIDGANVGYSHGQFDFDRVIKMANFCVSHGKCPLVVIHCNYTQNLTKNQQNILNKWGQNNIYNNKSKYPDPFVYTVNKGYNDDWFILYAAAHNPHTKIISNDKFRDHLNDLMHNPDIVLWIEERVIAYDFSPNPKLIDEHMYTSRFFIDPDTGNHLLPPIDNKSNWLIITPFS